MNDQLSTMPSFLFDNNVSPSTAALIREDGVSAVHVKEIGHDASSDLTIMRLASERGDIIVTYDNDFPEILAHSRALGPSVILLREGSPSRPAELAELLSELPKAVVTALGEGAIVVYDGRKMRIRSLPVH